MKRYLCIGFVVALFASSVNADEPVRVAERRATTSRRTAGKSYSFHARKHPVNYYDTRCNPHRPPTRYEAQLQRYQQLYPKFYYGFHGRFLYTMGMPSGDVGIRGLPW